MNIRSLFWLLAFLMSTFATARADKLPLYIGHSTDTAEQGIALALFDTHSGALSTPVTVAATPNPTFLAIHPNGKILYAVNEGGAIAGQNIGGLSAFTIDAKTKALAPLNQVAAGGGLCYLSVDKTGKFLLAAAYGDGSVEVWNLKASGEIGERVQFISLQPVAGADEKVKISHGHQFLTSPDNRYAFAVDLGLDKVFIYRFDDATGVLTPAPIPFVSLENEAGPRHLTFSPDGKFIYLINETNNTMSSFAYADGVLTPSQTLPTLPADFQEKSYTAEVAVHPNGQFLYGSNRGRDSIAIFALEPKTGAMKFLSDVSTSGKWPRHFTLAPDGKWLLVGNQNDGSIVVFSVDATTGMLAKTSRIEGTLGGPACLLFAPSSTPAEH